MQRDPDFRLTVWYHGLKATQYFSKFTPESITVLKRDLTILGLPQPKNQNISLLSHGAVECCWPSAGMNPVLYRNFVVKTSPTPIFYETINQLSILHISVNETSASRSPILNSNLAKPTSLKRSYEQRPSTSVVSTYQLADTSRSHPNTSDHRPHLAHPNAVPSPRFPRDDSRPTKIAKTHARVFQASAHKSVHNGHPNSIEPSVPANRLQASTSTTYAVDLSTHVNPAQPLIRLATKSASNMTTMGHQALRAPSNTGSTVTEVEKERVDAFLNNLELQPTVSKREPPRDPVPLPGKPLSYKASPSVGPAPSNVRVESQGPTAVDSAQLGQVSGRIIPNYTTTKAVPTPTPPSNYRNTQLATSFPTPSWLHSESVLRVTERVTAGQGSTLPLVPPTQPSIGVKETSTSAGQPSAINPIKPQLAKGLKDVSQNIGEWFAEGHELRKHGVQGKTARPDREKAAELEKIIEELRVVKMELEEERRLRRVDKELLDVERQMREEAENALADVKRECRQPFVVPSLLDAFLELSKLTTRGLKVSGSQVEVPAPQDHREGASSAVVNGHNITAPHDKARTPPGVPQRTKVKLEPLDTVIL